MAAALSFSSKNLQVSASAADSEVAAIVRSDVAQHNDRGEARCSSPFVFESPRVEPFGELQVDAMREAARSMSHSMAPTFTKEDLRAAPRFLQAILSTKPATMEAAREIYMKISGGCRNPSDLRIAWDALCEEVQSLKQAKEQGQKLQSQLPSYRMPFHLAIMTEQTMIEACAKLLAEAEGKVAADPTERQIFDEIDEVELSKWAFRDRMGLDDIEVAGHELAVVKTISDAIFDDLVSDLARELSKQDPTAVDAPSR